MSASVDCDRSGHGCGRVPFSPRNADACAHLACPPHTFDYRGVQRQATEDGQLTRGVEGACDEATASFYGSPA